MKTALKNKHPKKRITRNPSSSTSPNVASSMMSQSAKIRKVDDSDKMSDCNPKLPKASSDQTQQQNVKVQKLDNSDTTSNSKPNFEQPQNVKVQSVDSSIIEPELNLTTALVGGTTKPESIGCNPVVPKLPNAGIDAYDNEKVEVEKVDVLLTDCDNYLTAALAGDDTTPEGIGSNPVLACLPNASPNTVIDSYLNENLIVERMEDLDWGEWIDCCVLTSPNDTDLEPDGIHSQPHSPNSSEAFPDITACRDVEVDDEKVNSSEMDCESFLFAALMAADDTKPEGISNNPAPPNLANTLPNAGIDAFDNEKVAVEEVDDSVIDWEKFLATVQVGDVTQPENIGSNPVLANLPNDLPNADMKPFEKVIVERLGDFQWPDVTGFSASTSTFINGPKLDDIDSQSDIAACEDVEVDINTVDDLDTMPKIKKKRKRKVQNAEKSIMSNERRSTSPNVASSMAYQKIKMNRVRKEPQTKKSIVSNQRRSTSPNVESSTAYQKIKMNRVRKEPQTKKIIVGNQRSSTSPNVASSIAYLSPNIKKVDHSFKIPMRNPKIPMGLLGPEQCQNMNMSIENVKDSNTMPKIKMNRVHIKQHAKKSIVGNQSSSTSPNVVSSMTGQNANIRKVDHSNKTRKRNLMIPMGSSGLEQCQNMNVSVENVNNSDTMPMIKLKWVEIETVDMDMQDMQSRATMPPESGSAAGSGDAGSGDADGEIGGAASTWIGLENSNGSHLPRLKVKDALHFLDLVKLKYWTNLHVYFQFLELMETFMCQMVDTPSLLRRVSSLFRDNPELIIGFNTFLPPGYKINPF